MRRIIGPMVLLLLGIAGTGLLGIVLLEPLEHSAAQAQETEPGPAAKGYRAGHAVYVDNCMGCHGYSGKGMPGVFPSFKGSPLVGLDDPTVLINWVLHGAPPVSVDQEATDKATPASYGIAMPAFYWKLSDAEIAAVTGYVRNAWGNTASAVEPSAVAALRQGQAAAPR